MTWPAASDTTVMPAEPEPTQAQLKAIASESHKELRGRAWLSLNPSTAGAAKMTIGQLEQFAMGHFDPTPTQLRQLQIQLDQWDERP